MTPSSPRSNSSPHEYMLFYNDTKHISDEEKCDESNHPAFSKTSEHAVCIYRLDMTDLSNAEVYIIFSQILDPHYTLQDTSQRNCKGFVKSMGEQGLHHSHEMMSVFSQAVGNHPNATVTSLFEGAGRSKSHEEFAFPGYYRLMRSLQGIEMVKEKDIFS